VALYSECISSSQHENAAAKVEHAKQECTRHSKNDIDHDPSTTTRGVSSGIIIITKLALFFHRWISCQVAFYNAKQAKFGILNKLGSKKSVWHFGIILFIKFSIFSATLNFGISI